MQNIYSFLENLASQSAQELHIEPNKVPYLVSENGQTNLPFDQMQGPQISLMVFPIIPEDVKLELPNKTEIEFPFSNKLGDFHFKVKKSPSGFNVIVRCNSLTSQTPSLSSFSSPQSVINQTTNSQNIVSNQTSTDNQNFEQNIFQTKNQTESAQEIQNFSSANENISNFSNPQTPIHKQQNLSQEKINPMLSNETNTFQSSQPIVEQSSNSFVNQPQISTNLQSEPEKVQTQPSVSNFSSTQINSKAKERMDALFYRMAEVGSSDLHLSVSVPPMIRKDGRIQQLECNEQSLTPDSMKELLMSIMPDKNREEFERRHDTDFAYEIRGLARFRANIFMDRKGMGGVFRIIPSKILTAQDLGLSEAILNLCELSKGLVVVTGPTGSGKSTTLCAMVDHINQHRDDHLITIEDPIEFVHDNKKCLVNQREVHNHTDSFKDALRAALREDPDILLVGEMRDLETISIAIETAETGHLVFGTLHTTTAASTVDRIIDQFPADRQQQIRVMLSESLKGVIAQTLLPKKGGGRIAALEVLIVTPAISNLIREGKTFQIPSAMQTGKQHGMVLLNDALINLVQKGLVEAKDAYIKAVDKTGFEMALNRVGLKM
jgi:twitching motility protein PilT